MRVLAIVIHLFLRLLVRGVYGSLNPRDFAPRRQTDHESGLGHVDRGAQCNRNFRHDTSHPYDSSHLQRAISSRDFVEVKWLVNNRDIVNRIDAHGNTSIHYAARKGDWYIFNLLMRNKANVKQVDKLGNTPLHIAAECGHYSIVKRLIDENVVINATNNDGITPLHLAARWEHLNVVNLLWNNGALIWSIVRFEEFPLYLAALRGRHNIVKILLQDGADCTKLYEGGKTLLHIAAAHGHYKVVQMLAKYISVDAECNGNRRPLHYAISNGHIEVSRVLCELGADVLSTNCRGESPFGLASDKVKAMMLEIMLSKGNASLLPEQAPHIAVRSDNPELMQKLLDQDISLDEQDSNGQTALHLAVIRNNFLMVKLLVENGAKRDQLDNSGKTALHYALAKYYNPPVLDCLLRDEQDLAIVKPDKMLVETIRASSMYIDTLDLLESQPCFSPLLTELPSRFHCKSSARLNDSECPICFKFYRAQEVLVRFPCNHVFHELCAVDSFKWRNTCAMCRDDLGNYSHIVTKCSKRKSTLDTNRNDGHRKRQRQR